MSVAISTLERTAPDFPRLLAEAPGAPSRLYYRGTLPGDWPLIAIVGTRKATREGRDAAYALARDLAGRRYGIVSGLALGIDAAAHEGALAGSGYTLAVLAHGLGSVYPPRNAHLADRILLRGGALVSEYPAGEPPYPAHFLERNRIVSGLAVATVVVEAPQKSGALATAAHAAAQGREVFVLMGPARHPNYAGSHLLIRQGARAVRGAEDILEDLAGTGDGAPHIELPAETVPDPEEGMEAFGPDEEAVIAALQTVRAPQSLDALCETTGLSPAALGVALTNLVFDGQVEENRGIYMIKRK